ncbi:MAG: sortase [Patescibacteria group bacterium]|nr:sortase [Patescibacteria group bacterium]
MSLTLTRRSYRSRLNVKLVGLVTLIVISCYVLITASAPAIIGSQLVRELTASRPVYGPAVSKTDTVYLPSIGVSIPIVPVAGGNEDAALENGAIHRSPNSGSPKSGGNYVLAAHRFSMRLTPAETVKQSPLYNLNYVRRGDSIVVDHSGSRYEYVVVKKHTVHVSNVEIEQSTRKPQLTLYTCELSGSKSGRDVVVAVPKAIYMANMNYTPDYIDS